MSPAHRLSKDDFWSKVEIRSELECWPWSGRVEPSEYGKMMYHNRRLNVHRLAYQLCGKAPKNPPVVRHVCDNRACCNPLHLLGGTHKQNVEDMDRRGRRNPPTGEGHPGCKISDEEAEEIRVDTRSQRIIAREYGISQGHVCRIKNGKQRRRP